MKNKMKSRVFIYGFPCTASVLAPEVARRQGESADEIRDVDGLSDTCSLPAYVDPAAR